MRFFIAGFTTLGQKVALLGRLPFRLLGQPERPAAPTATPSGTELPLRLRRELGLSADRPPDIFFISLDSLRASAVAPHGPRPPAAPYLEQLARSGLVFERAYAPSAETVTTLATWAAADPRWYLQRPPRAVLYAALKARGYATLCLIPWRWAGAPFGTEDPGCDRYQRLESLEWVDRAIRAFAEEVDPGRPLFMQLHLMAMHAPWPRAPDRRHGEGLRADYLAQLQRVDQRLQEWMAIFASRGRLEHAVIIVTADHGESLGERGVLGHQSHLYEEQTRVPLIVWSSGGRHRRIAAPVSNGWLGRSLLALAGATPPGRRGGPSILDRHPVFLRQGSLHGVVDGRHKLIVDRASGTVELYDLGADPGERHNLVARQPVRRQALLRLIEGWTGSTLR